MIFISYWQRNNIRLRAFENKDLQKYISERPDTKRQWLEDRIELPNSEEQTKKILADYLDTLKTDDKSLFVLENLDGDYIGEISVWLALKPNGLFRYGIFLDDKFRYKGYAKDALVIVLDYYFNELNYHKAGPTVYSYNEASQKFHEKFGFIKEAELKEEVYTRGKYYNMIYYSMTKDQFNDLYIHDFLI